MFNETDSFKALFAVSPKEIKPRCLLLPFINGGIKKALGITQIARGSIYSSAQGETFTLIVSPMGAAFCADAVLYLARTPCAELVFFGACGTRDEAEARIGDLVCVEKALSGELFSDMLERKAPGAGKTESADAQWLRALCLAARRKAVALRQTNCLTVGSLALEKDYISHLDHTPFDVMDMETSAVYRAARARGIRACALLRITDCPFSNPLEQVFSPANRTGVQESMAQAAADIKNILAQLAD